MIEEDHCGALPYMSEIIGFNGPIYMTHPTKAIVPILLEELRKLNVQNKGLSNYLSTQVIKNCMKKVTAVDLHESVMVDNELEIKAYYAGHVLGAAMFWFKVGSQTVVYTGDFNMNPDRHLGAAQIDKCQPDLLIIESVYAAANPNTKQSSNHDFLCKVHECMSRGGKVLIPVFIFGRAQELCFLLDKYWTKMNFSYPIYFATDSFTEKANTYYKTFSKWTNQKIDQSNAGEDVFELKNLKPFNVSNLDIPEPMVVLATNGMLQHGLSMQIFKKWANDEKNMVILPDICLKGTLGHRILTGAKQVQFGIKDIVNVKLKVEQMSFDAVADTGGILKLIEACDPKNVILSRGKADLLKFLKTDIIGQFKIECSIPHLGEQCLIKTSLKMPSDNVYFPLSNKMVFELCAVKLPNPHNRETNGRSWILAMKEQRILLLSLYDAITEVFDLLKKFTYNSKIIIEEPETEKNVAQKLFVILEKQLVGWSVNLEKDSTISVESVKISVDVDETDVKQKIISVSWKNDDEDIAFYILYMLQHMT